MQLFRRLQHVRARDGAPRRATAALPTGDHQWEAGARSVQVATCTPLHSQCAGSKCSTIARARHNTSRRHVVPRHWCLARGRAVRTSRRNDEATRCDLAMQVSSHFCCAAQPGPSFCAKQRQRRRRPARPSHAWCRPRPRPHHTEATHRRRHTKPTTRPRGRPPLRRRPPRPAPPPPRRAPRVPTSPSTTPTTCSCPRCCRASGRALPPRAPRRTTSCSSSRRTRCTSCCSSRRCTRWTTCAASSTRRPWTRRTWALPWRACSACAPSRSRSYRW